MSTFNCKHCGTTNKKRHPKVSRNLFCNSKCAGDHKRASRKQSWLEGTAGKMDRATIRKYLTEDRGYKCECCNISEHNGLPITLQVDHIDGNPGNHIASNTRLICPNCHSQQDNWGAKNKGSGRKSRGMSLG